MHASSPILSIQSIWLTKPNPEGGNCLQSTIACGIRDQNSVEFWRLLWREMAPDNHSKSLIWRRSLLSPKFLAKETGFSAAPEEWEADLDKYEAEHGPSKAISGADKRTVVLPEAPTALKQHLSMHVRTLSFPHISLCVKWWCPICKQSRFGGHLPRMHEPPHTQEIQMPWTSALLVMAKEKGKKKAKERAIRRAKEKRPKEKDRTTTATRVAKVNGRRIVAPYAGKPAMPPKSVGSTQKANQRGRARKEVQASLTTIRQWSLQSHLRLKLVVKV